MQITFASGLAAAAERAIRKKQGNEETVWEKQQRLQAEKKSQRKKEKKAEKGKDSMHEDDIEWDRNDPFFASELADDDEDAEAAASKAKTKKERKDKKKALDAAASAEEEKRRKELELLVMVGCSSGCIDAQFV